jgi:hypothetical protein
LRCTARTTIPARRGSTRLERARRRWTRTSRARGSRITSRSCGHS